MPKNNMLYTKFYGDVEAYKAYMTELAKKGGASSKAGGFAANRELAKIAGAKGGKGDRIKRKRV